MQSNKSNLPAAYRYWRQGNWRARERGDFATGGLMRFLPAGAALALAREDAAAGRARYPSDWQGAGTWQPQEEGRSPVNRPTRLFYVEEESGAPFRLVGTVATEGGRGAIWSRPDRHGGAAPDSGWLTDPYGDSFRDGTGLIWGVVYQLAGRGGVSRYVAGYQNGGCSGGPLLDLGTVYTEERGGGSDPRDHDAARDAARAADRMAEHAAEEERDYNRAWQAGARWQTEGEEAATARAEALALLAERRAVRGQPVAFPAICGAIRGTVAALAARVEECRQARLSLARGDGLPSDSDGALSFFDRDKRLRSAFNEAAGETVLA